MGRGTKGAATVPSGDVMAAADELKGLINSGRLHGEPEDSTELKPHGDVMPLAGRQPSLPLS